MNTQKSREKKTKMALTITAITAGMMMGFVSMAIAATSDPVSPAVIEADATTRSFVNRTVVIKNTSNATTTYAVFVNSLFAGTEEGGYAFGPINPDDLSGWIKISTPTVVLSPGETTPVNVSIRIPSSATPGGHYASVFARATTNMATGTESTIGRETGAYLLLNVRGEVVTSAKVMEFTATRGRISPGELVDFKIRMKNAGNTHVKPTGVVAIYRGKIKVEEINVNPEGAVILPGATRRFSVASSRALPSGTYRAVLDVKYGSNRVSPVSISFVVLGGSSIAGVVATVLGIFVLILFAALLVNRKQPRMGARRM